MDPEVPGSNPGGGTTISPANSAPLKSPQARYARRTAAARGWSFRSLDGEDGYLFEVSDGARRAVFAAGAGSPYALNDVRAASIARDKAFCATVLRQAGLPVLAGEMFFITQRWAEMRGPGREREDALAYLERAQFPIFCKPISASNGLYAEVVASVEAFVDYMGRVSGEHFAILVQPYVAAPEHRLFVLEGRVLFSYQKHLPKVIGDGVSSVQALLDAIPRDPFARPAPLRAIDDRGAPIALEAVIAKGRAITIAGPANRSAGGRASAIAETAPPAMAALALKAAEVVGLGLAAVDMFDRSGDGLAIIEVNSNPMIATLEDAKRWDLIETIWAANIEAAWR